MNQKTFSRENKTDLKRPRLLLVRQRLDLRIEYGNSSNAERHDEMLGDLETSSPLIDVP